MPNPWIAFGCVLLWLGSLVGAGYWQNDAGHVAERVDWQKKDNQELAAANAKIVELTQQVRATEHNHATQLADISTKYEEKLQNANAQKGKDIAAARAGTLRLHYTAPTAQTADIGAASSVAAAPGGCNGATAGELPPEITANLYALADDADTIVVQLGACQDIVRQDRAQ